MTAPRHPKRTVPARPRQFDPAVSTPHEHQTAVHMGAYVKEATSHYFQTVPAAERSDSGFAAYMSNLLTTVILPELGYWQVTAGGTAVPEVQWAVSGPGATSPQAVGDWAHLQDVADGSSAGLRRYWRMVGTWCDDTVRDVRTTEK